MEPWSDPLETNPRNTKAEIPPFLFVRGVRPAGAQALVSCFHTGLKITYPSIKARSPGPHPLFLILLAHRKGLLAK